MASLLDFLGQGQSGGGLLGSFGGRPQSDEEKQRTAAMWRDAMLGGGQGVQQDPFNFQGSPSGIQPQQVPFPGTMPSPAPIGAPPGVVPFLNQPQQQMSTAAPPMPSPQNVPAPAGLPPGAMPVSLPTSGPAPAAAPSTSAAPSFMGGLNNYIDNNRATLMALAGGLASGGIGEGFGQAARVSAANAPKFGTIGHDIFGNPQMGWINPQNQTVKPLGAVSGGSAGIGGLDSNKPMYPQLPKAQQGIVDTMLSGKLSPPTAMALRTPYWNTLLTAADERAKELGQSGFDATLWSQKKRAADDLAPQGKSGQTINALDTVEGHIEKLSNAVDKLDNSDFEAWNYMRNAIAKKTPLDPVRAQKAQAVDDAIKPVLDEMSRAYKAGHMSDTEIKSWGELIKSQGSKTTQLQAIADFVDFLNTKREAVINQYKALDVPFKGPNEEQNQRVTKLVHDRNVPAGSATQQAAPAATSQQMPVIGTVQQGYRFKGGNPANQTSWEKI
jgi:hypothetical protein